MTSGENSEAELFLPDWADERRLPPDFQNIDSSCFLFGNVAGNKRRSEFPGFVQKQQR